MGRPVRSRVVGECTRSQARLTPAAPDQALPGVNRGALGSEIGSGQQGSTANTPGG